MKDDRQIPARKAEEILGFNIDKRRSYALINGQVCKLVRFTQSCSGCFEGGECMGNAHNYPYDQKARCHIGSGCHECGYTGKRVNESWVPVPEDIAF